MSRKPKIKIAFIVVPGRRLKLAGILLALVASVSVSFTASAQSPARIGTSDDGRSTVTITVPLSEDEDSLNAVFDFGHTKGFLGPSSDPSDQSGFSNADKTIMAVNHQPATKSSYVHLFLRSATSGDITFINNVNARVARLLKGRWAETAKSFLRVESISNRNITFQTVDFDAPNRAEYRFTSTFSRDGTFLAAQKDQLTTVSPSEGGDNAGGGLPRLGFKVEQLDAMMGSPDRTWGKKADLDSEERQYTFKNYSLGMTLWHDKVAVMFIKHNDHSPLTQADIDGVLASNAETSSWKRDKSPQTRWRWHRLDNAAVAWYVPAEDQLSIASNQ